MSRKHARLCSLYDRYLSDADSASFIRSVADHYTIATLERLAEYGGRMERRGAVLALGFLGDFRANAALGRRLNDADRGVRMLAENGIRDLWFRDGTDEHQRAIAVVVRLIAAHQYQPAASKATELIDDAPWFAEAWNQRAIACFHLRTFRDSANDCQQTLELNAYHFGAAVGMGHCYLEMNDGLAALECFRRALKLNPGLEGVRAQVTYLQRALEERLD